MNSTIYWKKREEAQKRKNITDEKEYDKKIKQIYEDVLDNVQKEIDAFYGKYAKAEGITIAEAKKRVSKLDIEQYERKAERYVREKEFSKEANEEMRLYNATMKINRLEMLKANIGLELISGHDELQKYMKCILQGRTEAELKRQAGILGETIKNNAQTANAIVNASFHNAKYSDRIWMNQDILKSDLSKLLQSGLIQGKNPRVLAREIKKKFDISTSNAERLMRTELARVQTEAQKQSFERNGFTQYTFLALGDACDVCKALDDKHFNVKDMMPGKNAPPMHPNCRCSIAAYEDSEEYEKWLENLENGGTTEDWNKLKNEQYYNESGKYHSEIRRIGTNDVDLEYIKSSEFRRKFSRLTNNTSVNESIRQYAMAMLTHRNGTDGEDLYIINAETANREFSKTDAKEILGVQLNDKEKLKIRNIREKKGEKIIGIHNHPTNVYPTGSDFATAGYRRYKFGVVVTHDGRVFKYSSGEKPFKAEYFDKRVDKYTDKPYNLDIYKAHEKVLEEFRKEYGI